jgi:hypothetical protein
MPAQQAAGNRLPYVLHPGQLRLARRKQIVDGRKTSRQCLGDPGTDVQDPEPEDQPPEACAVVNNSACEE